MARRNGRPGAYLVSDDYSGFTKYNTEVRKDFWGSYSARPLLRNLQEIASPLSDPYPVPFYRGPNYETTEACIGSVAPAYVGKTTIPTNQQNMAFQVLNLDPAIPTMEVGCNFTVR